MSVCLCVCVCVCVWCYLQRKSKLINTDFCLSFIAAEVLNISLNSYFIIVYAFFRNH